MCLVTEKLTYDANVPRLVSDQIGKISTTYGYNLFNELASYTTNYVDGGTTTPLYQVT